MRKIKGVLLLCILLCVLAGCGKQNEKMEGNMNITGQGGSKGGWTETDITPEENVRVLTPPMLLNDGTYVCYAVKQDGKNGKLIRYIARDEEFKWEKEELDWQEKAGGRIRQICELKDGYVLFSTMEIDEEKETLTGVSFWEVKPLDHQVAELSYLRNEGDGDFALLNNHKVIFTNIQNNSDVTNNGDDVKIADLKEGKIISSFKSFFDGGMGYLSGKAVYEGKEGDSLYYLNYKQDAVMLCSVNESGKVSRDLVKIPNTVSCGYADEDGNYYYVADGSITRVRQNDYTSEKVMKADTFEIGMNNNYVSDMSLTKNKNIVCVVSENNNWDQSKLYLYKWDETVSLEGKKEITVWSLYKNATVLSACAAFQKQYPDIHVEYTVGVKEDTDKEEDAIKQLNTQLFAGKGPDVLILDGLDYQNYKDKGILLNIKDMVDTKGLLTNIYEPFIQEDGSCYAVPARFSIPVICGEKGDLDGITDLGSMEKEILSCQKRDFLSPEEDAYYEKWPSSKRYGLGIIDMDNLLDFTLQASANTLIEDGAINKENLQKVMKFAEDVGQFYGIKDYPDNVMSNGIAGASDNTDVVTLLDGMYEYSITQHARWGWATFSSPAYFAECRRVGADKKINYDVKTAPGLMQNAYFPAVIIGVGSYTKNETEAKDFINLLLSEKIQDVYQEDGFAIRESSLQKSIDRQKEDVEKSGYNDDIMEFIKKVNSPVLKGRLEKELEKYMKNHVMAVLEGKETENQALEGVLKDAQLMLKEL